MYFFEATQYENMKQKQKHENNNNNKNMCSIFIKVQKIGFIQQYTHTTYCVRKKEKLTKVKHIGGTRAHSHLISVWRWFVQGNWMYFRPREMTASSKAGIIQLNDGWKMHVLCLISCRGPKTYLDVPQNSFCAVSISLQRQPQIRI